MCDLVKRDARFARYMSLYSSLVYRGKLGFRLLGDVVV